MSLSILSGPQSAKYFEDNLPRKSPNSPALYWFLVSAAGMAGPEGEKFRQNHAHEIVQALLHLRKTQITDNPFAPSVFFQHAFGPVPKPGQPAEPVRDLYIQQFLNTYHPTAKELRNFTSIQFKFNELLWVMNETRPEPYLQVLSDKRFITGERTWDQISEDLIFALSFMAEPRSAGPSLSGHIRYANRVNEAWNRTLAPTPREIAALAQEIARRIAAHPENFGMQNAGPMPPHFLSHLQTQNLSPVPNDLKRLTLLFSLKNLDGTAKATELAFAVSTGYLSPGAIHPLLARPEPYARKAAIDLIIRWPTPDNQSLLPALAADPDITVSAHAKSAEKFIVHLNSLSLYDIPAPFTPEAITFFNLEGPSK